MSVTMDCKNEISENKKPEFLCLVGAIAFLFSSGRWNVPVMAWIWPFCFLAFERKNTKRVALPICCLLMMGLGIIKWYGLADPAFGINLLTGAALGLLSFLPFLVDAFFYDSIGSFLSTLLLPCTFAVEEFLMQFSPCGMLGAVSATQTGLDPLVQIASVFGSYSITFLVIWFAPFCLFTIESCRGEKRGKRVALLYPLILVLCLTYGGIRLAFADVSAPNVKIAVTTGPYPGDFMTENLGEMSLAECTASLQRSAETAAGGKADLLCYCEEAFQVKDTDEAPLLTAAQQAARENGIFLLIAMETTDTDGSQNGLGDNLEYLIDSDGNVVWKYQKTHLVALMETGSYTEGDGVIPNELVTFPCGQQVRIASVICMDSDFPAFIRNGLSTDTALLLVPTWDWAAIRAYHTKWVELRAVENGVSLVRSCMDGVSTATDPYGRVIMHSDTAGSGYENVVFAEVPAESVPTIYHAAGAVIDWCYVAGFASLVLYSIIRKKQNAR